MFDDLAYTLGEYSLEHRFWPPKGKIEEKKQLERLMAISPNGRVSDMCYMKLHRLQLDRIIVDAVLHTVSQIERLYILHRYQDKRSAKAIECNLNLTKSKQIRIHKKICKQIGNILLYRLNPEDIFYPKRIINILNVIDSRLMFLLTKENLKERVGQEWLDGLENYREKNSRLLAMQTRCLTNSDKTAFNSILSCKLSNPELSNIAIGKLVNYTASNVSINLSNWESLCNKIFEC